jgi:hypothetical protein
MEVGVVRNDLCADGGAGIGGCKRSAEDVEGGCAERVR